MAIIKDTRMAGSDIEERALTIWTFSGKVVLDFDHDDDSVDADQESRFEITLSHEECVSLYADLRVHLCELKKKIDSLKLTDGAA